MITRWHARKVLSTVSDGCPFFCHRPIAVPEEAGWRGYRSSAGGIHDGEPARPRLSGINGGHASLSFGGKSIKVARFTAVYSSLGIEFMRL